ncbi:membrane dipeptidase [Massilia pseudoviolaceinigra]|uniref:membrane dipeptidase n=1 Tax=Massilia pseudoviolaceinigra TaxID=3057165 RepID=UPI0027967174|nr:membrane dipeptidase [Massilia sp. CCM 9206]MDQ1920724.1 membrane dipeptidase [Massilia sp. CCM 9206]
MKSLITIPLFSVVLLGAASAQAGPTWDSYVKDSCQANGTRQWSAKLKGDTGNMTLDQVCKSVVGVKVGGTSLTALPNRCVSYALAGWWGEWNVPDTSCAPSFHPVEKGACSGTKFGARVYSARVNFVPPGMSWETACRSVKVANIAGWEQPRFPDRCLNKGTGEWGEWDSMDGSCQSSFGPPEKKQCSANGKRLYTARLENTYTDWDYSCKHTSANIAGQAFSKPDRCVKEVTGEWGEFNVNDSSCAPKWTNVTKGRCSDSGRRIFMAKLNMDNLGDFGLTFAKACTETGATIHGPSGDIAFKRPTRCTAPDSGEFEVFDSTCSPANDSNIAAPAGSFIKSTAHVELSCNDVCANSTGNWGFPAGACVKGSINDGPNAGKAITCGEKPASLYAGATAMSCTCAPPATGFADTHAHQMAHLGFGGRAFVGKAFGPIEEALPWCDDVHGPGGALDSVTNVIGGFEGLAGPGHKVGGFPQYDGWPRWNSLTHQQIYEDWLKRAVDGGMRLMVMHAVNNQDIFGVPMFAGKAAGRTKEDMEAVDLQLAEAFRMQQHIDNKAGGAGLGWYRIVKTPAEARAVNAQGKLAVVLGMEVDHLFDCYSDKDGAFGDGVKNCDAAFIETQLTKYFNMGVRHLHPIHFKENAFGGAALYNAGTWDSQSHDCSADGYSKICGSIGLKPSGKALVRGMMKRGMLIDVDHMDRITFRDTMTMTEQHGYPVISGHVGLVDASAPGGDRRHEGNLKDEEVKRILAGGGMVSLITAQGHRDETPTARRAGLPVVPHDCGATSQTFAQTYLHLLSLAGPNGRIGFSTDFNGFAGEPAPRFGVDGCFFQKEIGAAQVNPTQYPLSIAVKGSPSVLGRSKIGERTFDINGDGLAHIGMLPDFIADLRTQGLRQPDLAPLMNSAESYIRMWEQAVAKSTSVP